MKVWAALGAAVILGACDFAAPLPIAPVDAARDGGRDAPPDVIEPLHRVADDLIGLWTFDEPDGSRTLADSSGHAQPVPLMVEVGTTSAPPVLGTGELVAASPGRVLSAPSSRLPADCVAAGGATLEVWAAPMTAIEGADNEPRFVAGLGNNVLEKDFTILHAGDHWMGRARTTIAADGTPSLTSAVTTTTTMTHVVLIADATHRALYVNGHLEASSTPSALQSWDLGMPMMLVDEYQHARPWTGTLALVALYSRALNETEIQQNFDAGPDAE